MEELKVLKDNAVQAYKLADASGKTLLSTLFGKKHFQLNVMERVRTFEDACEELGIEWKDSDYNGWEPDEIAYKKLKIIVKALNEGKVLSFADRNQEKWYAWFEYSSPGFRFHVTNYTGTGTAAGLGSRLCLHSQSLAKYFGTQFIDLINQYLKQDHEN